MTKFAVKIHLSRYQIIFGTLFIAVLRIFVTITLKAVTLAVISVPLGAVYPTVQTVLVVIILFLIVLNCFAGYMILILYIINFGKIVFEGGLSPTHHHISKQRC